MDCSTNYSFEVVQDEDCSSTCEYYVCCILPWNCYVLFIADGQFLRYEQMELFLGDPVFVFPQLLPESRFVTNQVNKSSAFTEAEDKYVIFQESVLGVFSAVTCIWKYSILWILKFVYIFQYFTMLT